MLLGLGQGQYKVILKHLEEPESKEVLKKKKKRMGHVKGTQEPTLKELPILGHRCSSLRDNINNLVLDYNPKYKIDTHETTVI